MPPKARLVCPKITTFWRHSEREGRGDNKSDTKEGRTTQKAKMITQTVKEGLTVRVEFLIIRLICAKQALAVKPFSEQILNSIYREV